MATDECPLMNRDPTTGRFVRHNTYASEAAHARAAKLTPERRREIATAGGKANFARLVEKLGSVEAAKRYMHRLGLWGSEETAFAGSPIYNQYEKPVIPEEVTRD